MSVIGNSISRRLLSSDPKTAVHSAEPLACRINLLQFQILANEKVPFSAGLIFLTKNIPNVIFLVQFNFMQGKIKGKKNRICSVLKLLLAVSLQNCESHRESIEGEMGFY